MNRINEEDITRFVNNHNYDVRLTHNARFTDQKCIPDVLCAVAECVIAYVGDNPEKRFTKNDIWHSGYSNQLISESFSKPDTESDAMSSEYDKFFAQPLKLLSAAGILQEEVHNGTNTYTITEPRLLTYISAREKNALAFLDIYLTKVMEDSGCMDSLNDFFRQQDKASFHALRERLTALFNDNTPVNNKYEPSRIYNKIINILAFRRKKRGTTKGRLSDFPITIEEIRYNRVNWRDTSKPKGISRQEYERQIADTISENSGYYERAVSKAKRFVRELELYSEIHHYPSYKATEAHHIFMKSDFPDLADMPENIIALTGTEHYSYAHPNRNTQKTDPDYQMVCLISKLDSIERNYQNGLNDYSLSDFAKVLNIGFGTEEFDERMGFEGLKANLLKHLRPKA